MAWVESASASFRARFDSIHAADAEHQPTRGLRQLADPSFGNPPLTLKQLNHQIL